MSSGTAEMSALDQLTNACSKVIEIATGEQTGWPGFDTAKFPGVDVMQAWWNESPYAFTAYYLTAPCHSMKPSWMGNREALARMGWGFTVVYVGRQVPESSGCKNQKLADLTTANGKADGTDAVRVASREGFPKGTIIYLDIEEYRERSVGGQKEFSLPDEMMDYFEGWIDQLLADGTYRPGVYCYRRFANQLLDRAKAVYGRKNLSPGLKFWIFVTRTGKFNLWTSPTACGIDYAQVWQGNQSEPSKPIKETYGGATLEIDQSVALTADPSAG